MKVFVAVYEHRHDNGFLNPDAWQGVAKEIKEKINKQYGEEQ